MAIHRTRPVKLLVCTDGSPASQGAIAAALALAKRRPCRLRWLQVLEYNPGFASQALDAIPEWEQEAREGLEAISSRALALGLETEVLVRRGEAAPQAILAEVEQTPTDLIVMGRRGRSDFAGMLMGSVTARIVGHSPVNVLVVPPAAPLTFQRLLVASDGSLFSEAACREALFLARTWCSQILAVCAAPKEADIPEAESILHRLRDEADRKGVPLDTLLSRGSPGEAILRAAQARGSDLLILGSHGRTGLTRLLMGSVAEEIIGKSPCPVLIVKSRPG